MNRSFVLGLVTGMVGVWAYHKWVKPPTAG